MSGHRGPTPEWTIAMNYRSMVDYGIPHAPRNEGPDGEPFMTAENTVPVRR